MKRFKVKTDKFKKARGGQSKILDIFCTDCQKHICFYQKDGSGLLKRMYIDRIIDLDDIYTYTEFRCNNCGKRLGTLIIYEKENRPAFRLFVGAVSKKVVKN